MTISFGLIDTVDAMDPIDTTLHIVQGEAVSIVSISIDSIHKYLLFEN